MKPQSSDCRFLNTVAKPATSPPVALFAAAGFYLALILTRRRLLK